MVDRGRAQDLNEAAKRFAESSPTPTGSSTGRQHSRQSASTNVPRSSRSPFRATSGADRGRPRKLPATLRAGTKAAEGLRGVPRFCLL